LKGCNIFYKMEYTIEKSGNGTHFILLDTKTAATLTSNNNKRVIATLNGIFELHCAIQTIKAGGYFVYIGSAICKKLQLKKGSAVQVIFVKDTTEYQFEMPEELNEVLNTDPEAHDIFHALTPGNQRGLMHLVTLLKSGDKRIERALIIAEKIKHGITSPRLILKK
jgi:Bacteriocin-protection, YdeI or OmpD-Associated/Domain of unknown function (DUF1905)